MNRFSDEDIKKIGAIKDIIRNNCQELFKPFVLGYQTGFYVFGGTFANLWHFLGDDYEEKIKLEEYQFYKEYKDMYPNTDLDIYVNVANKKEYGEKIHSLLQFYKDYVAYKDPNIYPNLCHQIIIDQFNPNMLIDTVQIIEIFHGSPDYIANTFDMEHSKVCYDIRYDKLTISPAQLELIKTRKILFYKGKSKNPTYRKNKWIGRGWTMYKEIEEPELCCYPTKKMI